MEERRYRTLRAALEAGDSEHKAVSATVAEALLRQETGDADEKSPSCGEELLAGYPLVQLLRRLVAGIARWTETGKLRHDDERIPLPYPENAEVLMRQAARLEETRECLRAIDEAKDDADPVLGQRLLAALGGDEGVALLLGCRVTTGTVHGAIMPSYRTLQAAFTCLHAVVENGPTQALPADASADAAAVPAPTPAAAFPSKRKPQPKLHVGARALCKHCHRCSAGWWGNPTGTEAAKNAFSEDVLSRIVQQCIWINIHRLPHDLQIMEVRVAEGYGARWTSDGTSFRGFLEPPQEGGHEHGWKH